MKTPMVSREVWRKLYDAGLRFKTLYPWQTLGDDRVWGVRDPETGQIGYCCVLGELAEVLGLCVYLGTEGLEHYRKVQTDADYASDPTTFLGGSNCLLAEFTHEDNLKAEDNAIIKDLGLEPWGGTE